MAETRKSGRKSAPHYKAKDVRGGEIILTTRRRRWLFIGGLAGAGVLALLMGMA